MFDPFKDFETAGYLRNFEREKDLDIVKVAEHELFRANLPDAVAYLGRLKNLTYPNFLHVHRLLFQGFYPWAGQDRATTAPESAIHKGQTLFAHPLDAQRAVNEGLRLGQDAGKMRTRPGEVMGLFAYGPHFWTAMVERCCWCMRSCASAQAFPFFGRTRARTTTCWR